MKYIISHARERIYISMSPDEIKHIEKELSTAARGGLKVVIITSTPLEIEGAIVYINEKQPGQIRLIADSSDVLTGEISGESNTTCLYSRNPNLIQLIKDSLTNEIKLIKLINVKED